ncbi:uncharacterized protein EV154DRAFT_527329 [Mucor mucedo]|uniref:uncharacterized protein n=1 Tax=Mucor mucedo TaxID=29922 RepID=UPI00221F372E|nr:uncharacterized protein EV154DRAFT_527329 [Mucor mucedo]KAI7874263.1 hypothetical protein EV154DRAFT_527329 [Mucor mucedo]
MNPERALPNHRQSTFSRSSRRSTFLGRGVNQNGPIVPNPNNSAEYNQELKEEYENLKMMNRTFENVLDNLSKTKDQLAVFNHTVDVTNGLLDIWMDVLKNAEEIKSVLKNPSWHGSTTSVLSINLLVP